MLDLTLLRKDKMEARDYQLSIAESALARGNTLVVMPTALGKTFIAVMLVAHFLKVQPRKKILFMTPTKPLALQQAARMRELTGIPEEEIAVVTGEIPAKKRADIYERARVFSATPQTIERDLKARHLDLNDFSLAVFDEMHRSVGRYAYVFIGKKAKQLPELLVLGLTASPSAQKKKIEEICENLGIKNIEVRQADDEDVKRFVKPIEVKWVFVDLPREFAELKNILREMLAEEARKLEDAGLLKPSLRENKKYLLLQRSRLVARIPTTYRALSVLAKILNILHAMELLESQGVATLKSFLEGMETREKKTKAVLSLLKDARVKALKEKCGALLARGVDHPKVFELKRIVSEAVRAGKSVIVFAHYRASAKKLVGELNALKDVEAKQIIGRAGAEGMKQEQQKELLNEFCARKFNVLVGTAILEEGLDLPAVDLVVFFEAVPSEIRLIQRRGRAGRVKAGQVIILVAKGTRDEAYLWSAKRKEEKMHRTLEKISRELGEETCVPTRKRGEKQKTISDFFG